MRLGRSFLVGDAAHINNPLGGMGMNGGIHDAINLTARLADAWHGRKPEAELDLFDRERRLVTLEYIEQQTIQNKRNLESDGVAFKAQPGGDRGRPAAHPRLSDAGVDDRVARARQGAWALLRP